MRATVSRAELERRLGVPGNFVHNLLARGGLWTEFRRTSRGSMRGLTFENCLEIMLRLYVRYYPQDFVQREVATWLEMHGTGELRGYEIIYGKGPIGSSLIHNAPGEKSMRAFLAQDHGGAYAFYVIDMSETLRRLHSLFQSGAEHGVDSPLTTTAIAGG